MRKVNEIGTIMMVVGAALLVIGFITIMLHVGCNQLADTYTRQLVLMGQLADITLITAMGMWFFGGISSISGLACKAIADMF